MTNIDTPKPIFACLAQSILAREPVVTVFKHPPTDDEVRDITNQTQPGTLVVARIYIPGTTYYAFRFLDFLVRDSEGAIRGARVFARDPTAMTRPSPSSLVTSWGAMKSE